MRTINMLILLAICRVASAEPKAQPDKFAKAAREAFEAAQAADTAGKLGEALRDYEKANAIAPHPATVYNIADVQRRMKNIKAAIISYEKYLELVPDAPDHKAVEKLLAELQAMSGKLIVEHDEPTGFVLVDGELLVAKSIEVPDGQHSVELVTPISYQRNTCTATAGVDHKCSVRVPPRVDGNVIISGPAHLSSRRWKDNNVEFQTKKRFQLEPGHYELYVIDKRRQCAPVKLDVAAGDDVTYAWVDLPKLQPPKDCVKVTIKQRTLHF